MGLLAVESATPAQAQAQAIVLVSNDGQTTATHGWATGAFSILQGFTTGSNAGGYILSSVGVTPALDATTQTLDADSRAKIRVELWTANTSGAPDSAILRLTTPSTVARNTRADFAAPANFRLTPNTTYFVAFYTTELAFNLDLRSTDSNNEDSGGQTGWSIADTIHWVQSGSPHGAILTHGSDPIRVPKMIIKGETASAQGPAAPTGLTVTSDERQLSLSWTAPSGSLTGYDVHYTSSTTALSHDGLASGSDPTVGWVDAGHSDTTPALAVRGLSSGVNHRVRVRAKNNSDPGPWAFGAGTPASASNPSAPRNVNANPGGETLRLSWEAPEEWGAWQADGYDAQAKLATAAQWVDLPDPGSTATRLSFTALDGVGLVNEAEYSLRIRARSVDPNDAAQFRYSAWVATSGVPRDNPVIRVDSTCTLAQAINEANQSTANTGRCLIGNSGTGAAGHDTIELSGDVTLTAHLPNITTHITINGNGHTIDGANLYRPITVGAAGVHVVLNDLTLTKGRAKFNEGGGAIILRPSGSSTMTLNRVTVSNNTSTYSGSTRNGGGIICSQPSNLTINDSVFSDNTGHFGGAIWSTCFVNINRSAFHDNTSTEGGGTILMGSNSALVMTNSTLYDNVAGGASGGGAMLLQTGHAGNVHKLTHVTMTGNSTAIRTGSNVGTRLELRNSIIYGSTGGDCTLSGGQITVNENNIIGAPGNCGAGTNGSSADPLLSPNATGDIPYFTIPANSPAVDAAGDCRSLTTQDQRGAARPQGGACDIGAYESPHTAPVKASLSASPNPVTPADNPDDPDLRKAKVTITATLSGPLPEGVWIPVTLAQDPRPDHSTISSIGIKAGALSGSSTINVYEDVDTVDDTFTVALDTANLPSLITAGDTESVTVTINDSDSAAAPGAAPPNFVVTPKDGYLLLTWDKPTGARVTHYDVQFKTTAAPDQAASDDDPATGWVSLPRGGDYIPDITDRSITRLTPGTAYDVRVRAVNWNAPGPWATGQGTPEGSTGGGPTGTTGPTGPTGDGPVDGGGGNTGEAAGEATRLWGADRYATSLAVAREVAKHADGELDTVVLAGGHSWTDALVAGPLAGKLDAAVLLTAPDGLDTNAVAWLAEVGASEIIAVGNADRITDDALAALTHIDADIERITADDPHAMSAAVAERIGGPQTLGPLLGRTVIVASSRVFADALAAGPLAAAGPHPILLVGPDALHPDVAAYLAAHADHVIVMGGTDAVTEAVEDQIRAIPQANRPDKRPMAVTRLGGTDRYSTAVAFARWLTASTVLEGRVCFTNDTVGLATGTNAADAAASAPLLARKCAPLVLTQPDRLPPVTASYLRRATDLLVFGGTAAITDNAIDNWDR